MERLIDAAPLRHESKAPLLADLVVPQIRRARALTDLNPASLTYGCADRAYWYYRTLTNFPGATWQQLMLAFACVFRAAHPANPYQGDPETAALVGAALSFWARSQHADGAFDEWYLNERSYCPTAITSAGAALTMHLMGDALPAAARAKGLAALERAGRWLEPRYNAEVMNQNLAAAAALQGLALLLPGSRWSDVARDKLERIRREQTKEGWFPEYGGMDFGYSTLALDLLAACRMLGAAAGIDEMAARLCAFLVDAWGAGPVAPGRLGSRGTSHAFPFGALTFAAHDRSAARLAQMLLAGIEARLAALPATVDDRYFAYFYLPQFALALLHAANAANNADAAVSSVQPAGRTDLAGSGLVVIRHGDWSVSISRRLGGALAIESRDSPPLYHLGYDVTSEEGRRYSSAVWHAVVSPHHDAGAAVCVEAGFRAVSSGLPLRRLMVPFQLVLYGLRSSRLAGAFQALIKRRMIAPVAGLSLKLERRIETTPDAIVVVDRFVRPPGCARITVIRIAACISMHSPSARQDPGHAVRADANLLHLVCAELERNGTASIRWRWSRASGCATHELPSREDV